MAQRIERVNLKTNRNIINKRDLKLIDKAIKVSLTKKVITASIKTEIEELGFSENFRGFNSHSGDTYIYMDNRGDFYFSLGLANVNQVGKGLEVKLRTTVKLKKKFGV